jgi:hypothetical protein
MTKVSMFVVLNITTTNIGLIDSRFKNQDSRLNM